MTTEVFQTQTPMPLLIGTLSPVFQKPTFYIQMPQVLLRLFFAVLDFFFVTINSETAKVEKEKAFTLKASDLVSPHDGCVMGSLHLSTRLTFKMKAVGKPNEAMPVKTLRKLRDGHGLRKKGCR